MKKEIDKIKSLVLSKGITKTTDKNILDILFLGWLWFPFALGMKEGGLYEDGIEIGYQLLAIIKSMKNELSEYEYNRRLEMIYTFLLNVLDVSDSWEEYLQVFEDGMRNITSTRTKRLTTDPYVIPPKVEQLKLYKPYIVKLDEKNENLTLHYLYIKAGRKTIIDRKVQRKNKSGKIRNLTHRQPDISEEERVQIIGSIFVNVLDGFKDLKEYVKNNPRYWENYKRKARDKR